MKVKTAGYKKSAILIWVSGRLFHKPCRATRHQASVIVVLA
uniref:Uncharacterized protein n=1 Tax=Anguilla anguilla TaxID=7936 RepID=A0A0E9RS86_ANGAN